MSLPESDKKRPKIILILGMFFLFWIIPSFFLMLTILLAAGLGKNLFEAFVGIFFLSSPIFSLVVGIGILKQKAWGRFWGLLMSLAMALIPGWILVQEYMTHPQNISRPIRPMSFAEGWWIPITAVVIFSGIALYLNRPEVKKQFEAKPN